MKEFLLHLHYVNQHLRFFSIVYIHNVMLFAYMLSKISYAERNVSYLLCFIPFILQFGFIERNTREFLILYKTLKCQVVFLFGYVQLRRILNFFPIKKFNGFWKFKNSRNGLGLCYLNSKIIRYLTVFVAQFLKSMNSKYITTPEDSSILMQILLFRFWPLNSYNDPHEKR